VELRARKAPALADLPVRISRVAEPQARRTREPGVLVEAVLAAAVLAAAVLAAAVPAAAVVVVRTCVATVSLARPRPVIRVRR